MDCEAQRVLIVANDFPYPPSNGASLDMWWRILALKKLGFVADLIATVRAMPAPAEIEAVRDEVKELFVVERDRGWKAALSWRPFQVQSRSGLRTVLLSREYAAVLMEAEHVAAILQNPRLRATKRILRVHNDEARNFLELTRSSKGPLETLFYLSEAAKFMALSPNLMSRCHALWFISDFEMTKHLKKNPADSDKSFFVPPSVEVSSMRRQPLEGRKVLFIGTLSLPTNIGGLRWYVANIHPLLSNVSDYHFLIAGNTRSMRGHPLADITGNHSNITLRSDPEDIESLYTQSAVFVNPVLHGSGLKLKTIDAIRAGMPVVTTSIGIEGSRLIPDKHVLVADSAQSFADSVRRLLNDKDLAQALVVDAQQFLAREYDQQQIIARSLSSIFAGLKNGTSGRMLNPVG